MIIQEPMFSTKYNKWLKWNKTNKEKPTTFQLTNNQHKFVEFMLKNKKEFERIGQFIHLYKNVRKFWREADEDED